MDESMLMRDIWTKMIISAWIGRISICYPLPIFIWLPMGMHKKYPSISLYYMRTWIGALLNSLLGGGGGGGGGGGYSENILVGVCLTYKKGGFGGGITKKGRCSYNPKKGEFGIGFVKIEGLRT